MTGDDSEAVIKRYINDVLSKENYGAIEEVYDTSFDEPKPTITGGIASTIEELKASYAEFHDRVSISDVEVLTTHATETEALAVWIGKTEYHDSFGGIQPAGNPQPHQELTWATLTDGYIDQVHHLRDSLETIPPAARAAHTSALAMVESGVIAVDRGGNVVFANPTVVDLVGRDRTDILDTPVEDLFGESVARLEPGETTELTIDDQNRVFEVTASTLRDERYDLSVGQFLLLYEITERKRRIQRLQVLNRVLRHNLRNNLDAIIGCAEAVAESIDDSAEGATGPLETIIDVSSELASISRKASSVDENIGVNETPVEHDLATLARRLVSRAHEEYPAVAVDYEGPSTAPVEAAPSLRNGLWELVENACEYSDDEPSVTVRVERRQGCVLMKVLDNGPGIADYELQAIETGRETALEHGSGLGLWIAKWTVETSGGTISFAENVPQGTVATVELPGRDR